MDRGSRLVLRSFPPYKIRSFRHTEVFLSALAKDKPYETKVQVRPRFGFSQVRVYTDRTIGSDRDYRPVGRLGVTRRSDDARGGARATECKNNLKQLGVATHNFESTFGGFPKRRQTSEPKQGWGPFLLPYLDQIPLADQYDINQNFYAPDNQPLVRTRLKVFVCPSAPGDRYIDIIDQAGVETGAVGAAGDYFAPNSVDAYWWPEAERLAAADTKNCTALKDNALQPVARITDGLTHTLLFAEFAGRPDHYILRQKQETNVNLQWADWWGPWAAYNSSIFKTWSADGQTPADLARSTATTTGASMLFIRQAPFILLCDGSVHFVSQNLDRDIFAGLVTKSGGEIINFP